MLTKTGIDYLTHCWNFYTGCRHTLKECPVADKCWARSMAHRFSKSFEPTLHPEKLLDPLKLRKPARIGVCFTGDLMGDWVYPKVPIGKTVESRHIIFSSAVPLEVSVKYVIEHCPQHQFIFLTKRPQNYPKWGRWPDNAWIGATVCSNGMMTVALTNLAHIEAKHKWLSFEPLMGQIGMSDHMSLKQAGIDWVVIGGWSGGKNIPPYEWIVDIVKTADNANIPIYLKPNLNSCAVADYPELLDKYGNLRHELPEER